MKLLFNKKVLFLVEILLFLIIMLACFTCTIRTAHASTGQTYDYGYEESAPTGYFDEKTGTYVSGWQHDVYWFIDVIVKRVMFSIALMCLIGGFIYRRFDHVNAVLRAKALRIELLYPTLYVVFTYVVCYAADSLV